MNFQLEIRDGFIIELPISDKAWVEQHEWYYDKDISQIYRVDRQGRKVPLWLDILRNSTHDERDIRAMMVIENDEIDHIFTTLHQDLWHGLQILWFSFEAECEELGIRPGEFYEFVSLSFCAVLGAYYDWETRGEHKHFEPDLTNLTPGRIITTDELVQYRTLGEWFKLEYWDWVKRLHSPCGVEAETQLNAAVNIIKGVVLDGVRIENAEDMHEDEIDSLLHKYLDGPIGYLVAEMGAMLFYYPIPTHV